MNESQIVAYLRGWASLNRSSVFGSADNFIDADSLIRELDKIEEANGKVRY